MVAMRSQQTGLVQKKKRKKEKEEKLNTNERKKGAEHSWYLMLIAVVKDCL